MYFYLKLKNINNDDNSITITGTTTATTVNVTNDTTSNIINRNKGQEEKKENNNNDNNSSDKRPTSSMFKEDYLDPIRRARLRYFNNTSSMTILSDIRSNDNIAHADTTKETAKGIKALMKDTTSSMSIKRHELVIVPASLMDPLEWFRSIDYYETLEHLIISLDTRQRLLTKERNLSYDMIHKIFRNMDLNNIYGSDTSSTNDHTNDHTNGDTNGDTNEKRRGRGRGRGRGREGCPPMSALKVWRNGWVSASSRWIRLWNFDNEVVRMIPTARIFNGYGNGYDPGTSFIRSVDVDATTYTTTYTTNTNTNTSRAEEEREGRVRVSLPRRLLVHSNGSSLVEVAVDTLESTVVSKGCPSAVTAMVPLSSSSSSFIIITGHDDGHVRVWDVTPPSLLSRQRLSKGGIGLSLIHI